MNSKNPTFFLFKVCSDSTALCIFHLQVYRYKYNYHLKPVSTGRAHFIIRTAAPSRQVMTYVCSRHFSVISFLFQLASRAVAAGDALNQRYSSNSSSTRPPGHTFTVTARHTGATTAAKRKKNGSARCSIRRVLYVCTVYVYYTHRGVYTYTHT